MNILETVRELTNKKEGNVELNVELITKVLHRIAAFGQSNGVFNISDAAVIHQAILATSKLAGGPEAPEEDVQLKVNDAYDILVQGANLVQKAGKLSFDDASALWKMVLFLQKENMLVNPTLPQVAEESPSSAPVPKHNKKNVRPSGPVIEEFE